ncbi:MAG: CPBP family intramembrane metalloprotease [Chloroflexi bacterium]|nr:CPBP family intramembrane metalloprotease [Chloroflexota bacterium]
MLAVPWRGGDILLGIGLFFSLLLAIVGASYVVLTVVGVPLGGGNGAMIVALALVELALLFSAWFFSVRKYGCSYQELGFRPLQWARHMPIIAAALVGGLAINAGYLILIGQWGPKILQPPLPPPFLLESGLPLLFGSLTVTLLAPVSEEAFFRGFLFPGLVHRLGVWGAALASALIFALGHLQWGVLIPIFFLGLILAWLYIKTGSLWSSITVHFAYNFLALVSIV